MATAVRNLYSQLFPSAPTFTEASVPDQNGKVFIVTGGNAGVGFELVKILYSKGAKVYMASRSEEKAKAAIIDVKAVPTQTPGQVIYLHLDLADLSTIKTSAETFAAQEKKLHVLWNNAGIAAVPGGHKTKQGHELHMGTNCLGPFLFTQLLLPQLRAAVKDSPKDSVRIIWTSSGIVDTNAPKGGIVLSDLGTISPDPNLNYALSKTGNWFLASEFAKRVGGDRIVSITQNPGNLRTAAWRFAPRLVQAIFSLVNHPPKYGAYTEIWAGLSPEITVC